MILTIDTFFEKNIYFCNLELFLADSAENAELIFHSPVCEICSSL